jgi:hypothetical protein
MEGSRAARRYQGGLKKSTEPQVVVQEMQMRSFAGGGSTARCYSSCGSGGCRGVHYIRFEPEGGLRNAHADPLQQLELGSTWKLPCSSDLFGMLQNLQSYNFLVQDSCPQGAPQFCAPQGEQLDEQEVDESRGSF